MFGTAQLQKYSVAEPTTFSLTGNLRLILHVLDLHLKKAETDP